MMKNIYAGICPEDILKMEQESNEEDVPQSLPVPPVARRRVAYQADDTLTTQVKADLILKITSILWGFDVSELYQLGVELINREEREAGE